MQISKNRIMVYGFMRRPVFGETDQLRLNTARQSQEEAIDLKF